MQKIAIIDIETTGFLHAGGKIVEVGIVELDLANGNKQIIFDQVTHEKGITRAEVENSWIIKNSNLTVDDVISSECLDIFKPEIQDILNFYKFGCTAFNNIFDFGFMEHRGFVFPKKLDCPMRLSMNVCKIYGKRGIKRPNVTEAYKFFVGNSEYVEAHRGADDAYHEADIVYELFKRGIFKI